MPDEKPKTAVPGGAPGGDPFRSDTPMASDKTASFDNVVEKRNADLGLTPDPGPVLVGEGHDTLKWRNPSKGETINGVNAGLAVTQRHSTAPDWFDKDNTQDVMLGAHVIGLESKASDVYNKDRYGDHDNDTGKLVTTQQPDGTQPVLQEPVPNVPIA